MITKELKSKILERFNDLKDDKILVSNILDKAYRFEKGDKLEYTNFLNLNEQSKILSILNELKLSYELYPKNSDTTKKVIFFKPSYIENMEDTIDGYISCIKIIPPPKYAMKVKHKDYMGSIYNLGIKREVIGDIFANEQCGYVFCLTSIVDYIQNNLTYVSSYEVKTEILSITSSEVKSLKTDTILKEYIAPSNRVDACLSTIYNLSRNEVKAKILKGDLYINDKNIFFQDTKLEIGDIVSFRGLGKFKFTGIIRTTKSDNLVIQIEQYM